MAICCPRAEVRCENSHQVVTQVAEVTLKCKLFLAPNIGSSLAHLEPGSHLFEVGDYGDDSDDD